VSTDVDRAVDRLLGSEPRPRADARRNLRLLVEAAQEAVAEVGVEVTAHDIARRAGVGIGTFYRRVPSREALLDAVLIETVEDILGIARAAVDAEPWEGFRTFARRYVQLRAASCGLNATLGGAATPLEPWLGRLRELFRQMVARAQDAGVMRADVTWQDVAFLLSSVLPDQHTIGLTAGENQWRRNLDILLDGLATKD
jgi:AcrR family transcriptional regulator